MEHPTGDRLGQGATSNKVGTEVDIKIPRYSLPLSNLPTFPTFIEEQIRSAAFHQMIHSQEVLAPVTGIAAKKDGNVGEVGLGQ